MTIRDYKGTALIYKYIIRTRLSERYRRMTELDYVVRESQSSGVPWKFRPGREYRRNLKRKRLVPSTHEKVVNELLPTMTLKYPDWMPFGESGGRKQKLGAVPPSALYYQVLWEMRIFWVIGLKLDRKELEFFWLTIQWRCKILRPFVSSERLVAFQEV